MEKLIELLNEYEEYQYKTEWVSLYHWEILTWSVIARSNYSDNLLDISEPLVYSKSYKFIQWLVDNDKIDFYKVDEVYYKKTYCWTDWKYVSYEKFLDEEILIMRLSIQDNPIEFLCSVLK